MQAGKWLANTILYAAAILGLAAPAQAQTLEEMAGQMIMVGFQGTSAADADVAALREALARGEIGGVMYLRSNVGSLAAVREMNAAFKSAPSLPPFIALDQEGGFIERLTARVGFEEMPSVQRVAQRTTPQEAERIYSGLGDRLDNLGFNINFGPVVDLNLNTANPIIAKYERAFSADPAKVIAYGAAFVRGHRQAGVLTALKHFPGHGSSADDSHEGFVDITSSWQPEELLPYKVLIDEGLADLVMVGHLYHRGYVADDLDRTPSSLSQRWITEVLRDELGFDGVVISDDMQMGAIREHFGFENTIEQAVMAGMDILLFSNTFEYDPGLYREILDLLVDKAEADPAFRARVEESYSRIVALKQRL